MHSAFVLLRVLCANDPLLLSVNDPPPPQRARKSTPDAIPQQPQIGEDHPTPLGHRRPAPRAGQNFFNLEFVYFVV